MRMRSKKVISSVDEIEPPDWFFPLLIFILFSHSSKKIQFDIAELPMSSLLLCTIVTVFHSRIRISAVMA